MYDTVHIILLTVIILEATWWFRSPLQPRQATLERNQPSSVFPRGSGPYWQQTQ